MIRYTARMAPVIARAALARKGHTRTTIHGRVMPSQLDYNLHVNQAVYAELFEKARVDWVIRSGAWERWRAAGVHPVVAEQRIVYRRELKLFAPYRIETRALRIEGRLLAFASHLIVHRRVHTLGEARLIFLGGGGVLDAPDLEPLCADLLSEPLAVEDWTVTR